MNKPKHPMEEIKYVVPLVDHNRCEYYDNNCVEDLVKSVRHYFLEGLPNDVEITRRANEESFGEAAFNFENGAKWMRERMKR